MSCVFVLISITVCVTFILYQLFVLFFLRFIVLFFIMLPTQCGKRLCRFTEKLQSEFTFLKKVRYDNDYDVYCTICLSSFSVSHGGRSDITDHLKTIKHKTAKQAATFSSVSNYFTPLKADC